MTTREALENRIRKLLDDLGCDPDDVGQQGCVRAALATPPAATHAPDVSQKAGISDTAPALDIAKTCDGLEQEAWESWAHRDGLVMSRHPLHYLFLDQKTSAARRAWKAGLQYAARRVEASIATQQPQPAQPTDAEAIASDGGVNGLDLAGRLLNSIKAANSNGEALLAVARYRYEQRLEAALAARSHSGKGEAG